jgi:hypothetical protein
MKSNLNPAEEAVIRILMAFAGSVIVGYIIFSSNIFIYNGTLFQFISSGLNLLNVQEQQKRGWGYPAL